MIRRVAEKLTANMVIKRKLPSEFGGAPIYVSPSAGLKFLFKKMSSTDAELFGTVNKTVKPGSIVWDIGANIGLFSFSAAFKAGATGKIFSFEPDSWLIEILRKSSLIQPKTNAEIKIIPLAIAKEVGLRSFNISGRSRAMNYLKEYGSSHAGEVKQEITVMTVTLDWLLTQLPPPTVLKIDVEGAEEEIFEGAKKLISEHRPTIICEVTSESSPAITKILKENKYRIFDGSNNEEVETAPWNTIAVPE